MTFKNENELKSFLLNKCQIAVAKAENKIYAIIKEFLIKYYQDYDPILYERTYQLLHSLVKSNIRKTRSGYEAEVYFDIDGLRYDTGREPYMEQVIKTADEGLHGVKDGRGWLYRSGYSGVDIWNTPSQIIDEEAINILVQELKSAGIPIKK